MVTVNNMMSDLLFSNKQQYDLPLSLQATLLYNLSCM